MSVIELNKSAKALPSAPLFRTICRIGYWLHVDAMWVARPEEEGFTTNHIHFNLVDGSGNRLEGIGFSIITTDTDTGVVVTDEDGQDFPDLETAIRCHAEELLKIDWQWTGWQDSPPKHRSWVTGEPTEAAFRGRDIAFATELATKDTAA